MNQPHRPPGLLPLAELPFDNSFVRELPADPASNRTPRPVRGAAYTRVTPTPVAAPRLLAWAQPVADLLGMCAPSADTGLEAQVLAGNTVLPGMQPYAARYGGHQFGHWAGQLGDGRAITLGEIIGTDGGRYELQLKGAGRTPYSRTADGRAVLRSSVREFMCSEAMHGLGVATTRALSLAGTGETVVRDMFYDGHPQPEPGAIVCRVAPSFVRFGNFEILAAQEEPALLRRLADYVITTHYPELGAPSPAVYGRWFEEICRRTALLIADWMRVGFVHGVMNTDNMSILGLTMDYGPYGWLEGYDLRWTPNTTDAEGRRYCYGNQPAIAQWNLVRLANALFALTQDADSLERALGAYADTFESASTHMLAAKLGLAATDRGGDGKLIAELFDLLQAVETDMTIFFRALGRLPHGSAATAGDEALLALFEPAFYTEEGRAPGHCAKLAEWVRRYLARGDAETASPAERIALINRSNPKYVLRNYLAQLSIDALAAGDASFMNRVMKVLERPYDEQPENEEFAARRPEWARHKAGCSALSCSS